MKATIKAIYDRPFRNELSRIGDILSYRAVMAGVSAAYAIRYRRALGRSAAFLERARRDVTKNRRSAFVFANGPSLGDIDLEKVERLRRDEGYHLIAINSFLSKSAHVATPTFAVFADNVHFAGGNTQYTADVETCRTWGIPYFAPAKYEANTDDLLVPYCSLCNVYSRNTADITRPAGYYGITAFFSLSLSLMLGYENIYMCGYDNSYFKNYGITDDGKMAVHHSHYYDQRQENTQILHGYTDTSQFFFDTFRHFSYIEKICRGKTNVFNIAKTTYLSSVPRNFDIDVYK